jgi:hypothetical protein
VRRVTALLFLVALWSALFAGEALAHGFGVRFDIPVPFWLYAYGAAAAVVFTFVLLVDERTAPHRYPRFDLMRLGWFRAAFASRAALFGLRLLSAALFALVVASGLLGDQTPEDNLAPTFVWILWWVGLAFLTALFGNLWELVNPWKIVFEWADGFVRRLGLGKGLGPYLPYPAGWGAWPALILYSGFAWVELVFPDSATPLNIAALILGYSAITWTGMILFGKDAWLRGGEAFSVFFGILARFAPTEARVTDRRLCKGCEAPCEAADGGCVNCYECFARAAPEDRQLNLRPPALGLARPERVTADRLAFVVFVLAIVTYDGLMATPLWLGVQTLAAPVVEALGIHGLQGLYIVQTLGLISIPLLFLAAYLGFVKLAQVSGGGAVSTRQLAAAYVYTLVPIAIAYQAAHYHTLLLIQGLSIVALASDPLGWGWNLFGTAGYEINVGVVSADFVWYTQVALIVVGHVVAVYLAHGISLRLVDDRARAVRSQYPMLALMVLYTICSLWILNQPIVEETRVTSALADLVGSA